MQDLYDYQNYIILFIDDEELTRKYFERNFKDTFNIRTAPDAAAAQIILDEVGDDVAIILSDQRMPGMSGTEFLESTRKSHPQAIRMLITAYSDMDATIAAINDGAVYKYITKPYEDFDLEVTIKRAMEFFIIQRERNALLGEKIGAMHRSILTERVLSMGVLASGISHHLRNSLTAVQAFLDLAPEKLKSENNAQKLNDPGFWNDLHNAAQGQVQQIIEMLSGVECCATITESGFTDRISLTDVVHKSLLNNKSGLDDAGIELTDASIEEEIIILGDLKLLSQAFDMLFKDASCFLPTGRVLKMESSKSKDVDNKLRYTLSICGLCEQTEMEDILPLFDPFHINKAEPSKPGIHLLGAFFLIYHHGGMINLSKGTQGSKKFVISLPADANQPLLPMTNQDFMEKIFRLERKWEDFLLGA